MGKIIAVEYVSLDGVSDEPGAWSGPWFDADLASFQGGNMAEADGLLLGRKTYEGFKAAWPQMTGEGADAMNSMPKYVVTSSTEQPEWNATFLSGDPTTSVAELKSSSDHTLLVNGSAQLLRDLLDHGLVDELRLMVFPVILGAGQRLFEGQSRSDLTLTSSQHSRSGVAILTYAAANAA